MLKIKESRLRKVSLQETATVFYNRVNIESFTFITQFDGSGIAQKMISNQS